MGSHEKRPRCWGREKGCFVLLNRRSQVRVLLGVFRIANTGLAQAATPVFLFTGME